MWCSNNTLPIAERILDMAVNPYVILGGNCREALDYYARVFDTPIVSLLTYGEMPGEMGASTPAAMHDLVAHAELVIHDTTVMFSDQFPVEAAVIGNNVGLIVTMDDEARLRTEFNALSDGGSVDMAPEPTFWAKVYGVLTDRYGVPWQFMVPDDAAYPTQQP
jgi:PhnB protein